MARPRSTQTKPANDAEDLLDATAPRDTELVLSGKEATAYERYLASAKALQALEEKLGPARQAYQQALIDLNNAAVPPKAQ